MMREWWFRLYIFAVIAVAVVVIVPSLPLPKNNNPSVVSIPIESLGFYSTIVPVESRFQVSSWLTKNDIRDQSSVNVRVQPGSLQDTTYRSGLQLQREVALTMEVAKPTVNFSVLVTIDPSGKVSPLTTIRCASGESPELTARCQEMMQS